MHQPLQHTPGLPLIFHTTYTFAPPTPPTPRTVQVRELRELFNAYLEQISAIEDPAVEVLLVQALEAVDMLDGAIALQKVRKGGVEAWGRCGQAWGMLQRLVQALDMLDGAVVL